MGNQFPTPCKQFVVLSDLPFQEGLVEWFYIAEGNPGWVAHDKIELPFEEQRLVAVLQDECPDGIAVSINEVFKYLGNGEERLYERGISTTREVLCLEEVTE